MDLLHLATKTVNQFGPPVQQTINFMLVSPPHDLQNIADSKSIKLEDYPQANEYDVPPVYDLDISQK
ncbi:hypothetical protein E2C01_041587 [Portunus trituberculatus]|uniref:Uncharacterized protein n=1 Tax=Portunus trituberculatus TaxID=210409 RepID=A0A5B7FRC0_PORTR|nr:hypothetical protein [Portunus trituberculatus]